MTGDEVLDALLLRRSWDSGKRREAIRYEHPASELAERFGVTTRTVERWRSQGFVPEPRAGTTHGTKAGETWHRAHHELPCEPCRLAANAYQRAHYDPAVRRERHLRYRALKIVKRRETVRPNSNAGSTRFREAS